MPVLPKSCPQARCLFYQNSTQARCLFYQNSTQARCLFYQDPNSTEWVKQLGIPPS
ncbi:MULTISPECIES: hypothetical protein [Moorena]|uniref:hypothetical protein n=1 Tax=Moorena TaxID=1155738 RepID=UPI001376317F|nr:MULTISPECIES: hypothetical protein [Moorena]NEP34317.1 hypothetical protein [Moorena sp. SIO3B2]NES46375.1 hypothetical protein [Moorena sp. SIO2C4]